MTEESSRTAAPHPTQTNDKTPYQHQEGASNVQIQHLNGDIFIGSTGATVHPPATGLHLNDQQTDNIRSIIKSIDLLDTELGHDKSQALMFYIISKATGANCHTEIPQHQYHNALSALSKYLASRMVALTLPKGLPLPIRS